MSTTLGRSAAVDRMFADNNQHASAAAKRMKPRRHKVLKDKTGGATGILPISTRSLLRVLCVFVVICSKSFHLQPADVAETITPKSPAPPARARRSAGSAVPET